MNRSSPVAMSDKLVPKVIADGHTEERFKTFSDKNTHRTRGSARAPKSQDAKRIALRSIALLDSDVDVVLRRKPEPDSASYPGVNLHAGSLP
jgi:hypothetical protein